MNALWNNESTWYNRVSLTSRTVNIDAGRSLSYTAQPIGRTINHSRVLLVLVHQHLQPATMERTHEVYAGWTTDHWRFAPTHRENAAVQVGWQNWTRSSDVVRVATCCYGQQRWCCDLASRGVEEKEVCWCCGPGQERRWCWRPGQQRRKKKVLLLWIGTTWGAAGSDEESGVTIKEQAQKLVCILFIFSSSIIAFVQSALNVEINSSRCWNFSMASIKKLLLIWMTLLVNWWLFIVKDSDWDRAYRWMISTSKTPRVVTVTTSYISDTAFASKRIRKPISMHHFISRDTSVYHQPLPPKRERS